ncbi:MAG: hypothetical protein IJB91_07515 [Oscillospiraceae bacterium]|nr:hypothetical protein [Oscillospiraceae bacterium]
MMRNAGWLLLFSLVILLVVRGLMSIFVQLSMSKKERKQYRTSAGIIDRWFLWSIPHYVKDRYSRYEKRVIHYTMIVPICRMISITLTVLFLTELVAILLNQLGFLALKYAEIVCIVYFVVGFVSFCIVAAIEFFTNRRYHRSRYKK